MSDMPDDTTALRPKESVDHLYRWLVDHLDQAHDITVSMSKNGRPKDSLADLKAAHDLLHQGSEPS